VVLTKYSQIKKEKEKFHAGCWLLTPVILVTQEAEIRRITVQSQPWQTVRLFRKKKSQKRAGGVAQGEGSEFKPQYCNYRKLLYWRSLLYSTPTAQTKNQNGVTHATVPCHQA
jgi:hypothetical protein